MDEDQEIPSLVERINALEQKLLKMESQLADLKQSPIAPVTSRPQGPPAKTATQPSKKLKPELSLESIIAGRWLNHIGLLLILIATAFGLKYAFDNEWIGPAGRVATGLVSGMGLLIFSQWLRGRGHLYFSEGITGLGGGVLYLSLYAGWDFYKLFSSEMAFGGMIAVTAAILWFAVRMNSQRVAVMALIGGFLSPMLVSTGQNAEVVLFSYLLILDASLLWLAWKHTWRALEPVAFFFSVVYFWGWYGQYFSVSESLPATVLFASAFFGIFVALPAIRASLHGRIYEEQVVLMLFNTLNYLFALHSMLWPDHRWGLTGAAIGLAALHLVIHGAIPREGGSRIARMLFAGLALTFVSLAIPIRLEGIWITMAWSIEGAVLIWNGFRVRWGFLRAAGFVLFAGVVFRFCFFMPEANVFLLNPRFASFVVAIASFAAAVFFWHEKPDQLEPGEELSFKVLGVGINVLALWALSMEVVEYFSNISDRLSRQMALSLLWTAYASGLLISGVRRNGEGLRWQGLVLFGIAVGKVFLYDLSFLSGGYRIISSIVLGVVLLGVSFLYQRRVSATGN